MKETPALKRLACSVFHRTSDNYCYPINNEQVVINLKTSYDVSKVEIVWGDPFTFGILGGNEAWEGKKSTIENIIELKEHLLWNIKLNPEHKRMKYYFILHALGEKIYFLEDGCFVEKDFLKKGKFIQCFTFPWLNENDVFVTPQWVNETTWYQIFPDRFCNVGNDNANILEWKNGKVYNSEIYGGNLKGIESKLNYMKDLGINGIYLTPIFEADSTHKYDTIDYYKIDPSFGTNEDFKALVAKAHELGIRIMVDCVFNHSGENYEPWQDVLQNGKESNYYDWFMINEWPIPNNLPDTRNNEFHSFAYCTSMPKLNTNNLEVQQMLIDVCKYWIDYCDIDAIRLDVANETSHDFNKQLRRELKSKKDIYILGEIWHDSIRWLQGDEFDSVMNYPLMYQFNKMWLDQEMNNKEFMYAINYIYTLYPEQVNSILFNLLDSHDTDRLINRFREEEVVLQQIALLLSLPGSPCIYYGTELFLEGNHDPDCRRCMPWNKVNNLSLNMKKFKELLQIRNKNNLFSSNEYKFEISEYERLLILKKFKEDKVLTVVLNLSNKNIEYNYSGKIIFNNNVQDNILCKNAILIYENQTI